MNYLFCLIALLIATVNLEGSKRRKKRVTHDVNVVGLIGTETTAPLVSTIITDILKDRFSVNVVRSRTALPSPVQGMFKEDIPFKLSSISLDSRILGPVSLFTDVIGYKNRPFYRKTPSSHIKIAYSMFEATKLPRMWVQAINESFDAIVVPDPALIGIYQESGVTRPIFCIPLPIYLEKLLARQTREMPKNPFIFGISAGFSERKNYEVLLHAFAQAFKNNPNVMLKIHGSWGADKPKITKIINQLKLKNVYINAETLKRDDYIEFIASLDAYVWPSAGEGYSLTPREALAAGIPCIVTDHTVHKSITQAPGVLKVPANKLVKARFKEFNEMCGHFHTCTVDDLAKALREMYKDYRFYKNKALNGRTWARQFLRSSLAPLFYTLIRPSHIEMGATNTIGESLMTTTDRRLLNLYISLYPDLVVNNGKEHNGN